MDKVDLDRQIKDAVGAHGCWKLQLKEAVATGKLPWSAEQISQDDQCTFGRWLVKLRQDPEIGDSPYFQAVAQAHSRFHQAAGHIATCVEKNRRDAAAELLSSGDFQKIADRLGKAIIDWRKSLH